MIHKQIMVYILDKQSIKQNKSSENNKIHLKVNNNKIDLI